MSSHVPGPDVDVDVLIVGGGPVGLLGGVLADRQGLTALVAERRDGPQRAPAAHVVNARTYEICRQAGLDMERIHAAGVDPADAGHVNFVTRLDGALIGRLPFERQGAEQLDVTPTPLRNLSQHRFEPILADEVDAAERAELRYGCRWERSEETDGVVVSELVDVGTEATTTIRSRYVIGCDGAGSRVRKSLGIEMDGPPLIRCYVMIHFAADLRPLIRGRPGVLHFVLDPEVEGAFVAHDIAAEWVFMHGIDPSSESIDDFDEERCRRIVEQAAGTALDVEILDASTWWMSAQTAQSMGRGRVFLAGDSAHRFPPTGGLGLNSGVQDIHGIMWRIGAIVSGRGGGSLLDTYEAERLPVARNNAQQSLDNAIKMAELAVALGTDVEPTTARLEESLADPDRGDAITAAVEYQREHFDLIGLHLGYVYGDGAVLANDETSTTACPSEYAPTARAGARLPHAWLDEVGGRSTLDLVPIDRPVLLTFGDHDAWSDELSGTAGERHAVVVRIGIDTRPLDEWRRVCGVGEDGALLVRPDQHVAWRAASAVDRCQLSDACDAIAGRIPERNP